MIDPTCGSGHFLLGGFYRMVDEWSRAEPNRNRRDVAHKALDAVSGVDLNPFAVAISRFRLLVAALQASDVHRLSEAPDFNIHVAIGDSLLHGQRFGLSGQSGIRSDELFDAADSHAESGLAHAYASEDLAQVQRILGRQYHAVVGNPPYIVVKDAALNAAYRSQYASCHRQYSLGAPFTERFFELALTGRDGHGAGFVGLITANSFMKREFGSKLIEQVLPRLDLTHVIDTSGAYLPGHGTPTVILFGRHRTPVVDSVRTVMGVKGEPCAPDDPAHGLVWSAIIGQVDNAGSNSDFITVMDYKRSLFAKHPWSIGGGGAIDTLEQIEASSSTHLKSSGVYIGRTNVVGEDDIWLFDLNSGQRLGLAPYLIPFVIGETVRDWTITNPPFAIYPYDSIGGKAITPYGALSQHFWNFRTTLCSRTIFGKSVLDRDEPWFVHLEHYRSKLATPLSICFAEVATHNHFVLDRGGKIFKQTAPVIKLPAGASEDEHLGLLGLLNSSVACFWIQQVCHNKGRPGADAAGADERYEMRYAINSTNIADFLMVDSHPVDIATRIDTQARQLTASQPAALLAAAGTGTQALPTRASLEAARDNADQLHRLMIARQEELDWRCYRLYGLIPGNTTASAFEYQAPIEVALGERAFEIVMARRVSACTEVTTWFARHGSTPITDIPGHWPEDYRQVVQRRIDLIENDRNIRLIERPEYKRRWNSPQWNDLEQAALRDWLLARLELPRYWLANADQPPQLTSTSRLADAARLDAEFMQMAELYAGHADFDPSQLVAQLVVSESVPFLPSLRYTEAGLRKRTQWEDTWALQRREDAGEEVGNIPVPPKYKSTDFLKTDVWRLRGGLDVPKDRWISYPGCERGADGSLVIAWAGWNHLQQATAIASYYLDMKDSEGWPPERLQPLLAGLLELVPWLEQWHNDVDPVYGERMGHYYKGFISEEARAQGFTLDDLRAWKPVTAVAAKRGRKKAAI